MNQAENAARFAGLHVKGAPLLLYNAWDAGSAKAILEAGGRAIATSSWSVAEAQGYRDGETIPIGLAEQIIGRIVATIDVPVTVDFEGGYSEDEGELSDNISRLLDLGVIGINFEDRIVKGTGLYDSWKRVVTTEDFPMADIILHHYETSPYSEKVRLGLGLKGLTWASVEIPVIMPKPDLTALTGGYRKTPVLQIGADIYCDSQLIMRELERRHPIPSFYPAGRGAADALAWWAEKTMFSPVVGIAFAKRPEALPAGFLEDRAKFSGRNIDPGAMLAAVPYLLDQLRAHFYWLDQMLADGRSFLQGSAAGLADLAAYHPVWFLQQNFGSAAAPLDAFPRLLTWAERVAAIGHGRLRQTTSREALNAARTATSSVSATVDPGDPIGRKPGQSVTVTPDDTGRDPVVGELIASGIDEIVVRRSDPEVGEVCVHFPRAGFVVAPA